MKQTNIMLLLSLAALSLFDTTIAQSDSAKAKKSYFKFNLNYLSNAVYSGRKDSSVVPYLRPSIGYFHKSGLYINSEVSLLVNPNEPKTIDLISLGSGYSFTINDKMDAGVYASKFFYSTASFAVESELKGLAGVYLGYNTGPVTINVGGDLLFSNGTDINANISLSHEFESGEENNKWTFNPTAQLNAGTQYFNKAYYESRKYTFATSSGTGSNRGTGRGHSSTSSSTTTTTTVKKLTFSDGNRFTILDYEFSFPVHYNKKRWGLYTLPVFAIPINPATYVLDNTIQKEKLSNAFFIEIGAYVKF